MGHRAAKYFDCFKTSFSDGTHFMFGAYLTLVFINLCLATILVCYVEHENFSFSNVAFVTAKPNQLCVNVTCGGFYCSLRLPSECQAESNVYSLLNGESQQLCRHDCQWTAEVLTTSNFENRTFGLYIMASNGQPIPFPILEGNKRIDVGITKYADRRMSPATNSWRVENQPSSSKYHNCGASLLPELKQDRRCGAYRLVLDDDELTKDPMPPLLLNMQTLLAIPMTLVLIHFTLQKLVNICAFMHQLHLHNYGPKSE